MPQIRNLGDLPKDWQVELVWYNDDYPCVTLVLSRDHGRIKLTSSNCSDVLYNAIDSAVQDMLIKIFKYERDKLIEK